MDREESQKEESLIKTEEEQLERLEREELDIESENHDGYRDVARLNGIKSEVEDLDTKIRRERQRLHT